MALKYANTHKYRPELTAFGYEENLHPPKFASVSSCYYKTGYPEK